VESTDEQVYTPTEAFASVVSQVEARNPDAAEPASRAEVIASMMVTLGLLDGYPEPGIFDNYEMGATKDGEFAGVITMFCRRCSTVLLVANDLEMQEDDNGNVTSVPSQYRMTLADFGMHALEHEQERHPDDDD
jgi:hypothetical protein